MIHLQMFLTVYRNNNEQNISEVPIMPETLCRDVVEFCKEPGEGECYLAEMWQNSGEALAGLTSVRLTRKRVLSYGCIYMTKYRVDGCPSSCSYPTERTVGERERMMEVLQQWGQHRGEVRYLLRHWTLPGPGGSRTADMILKRDQMDSSEERSVENGVSDRGITLDHLLDE